MCYSNECTYCGSPLLVGDDVIRLGDELFHQPCFADYNDELDRTQPINHADEEEDIDGEWTRYADEWPCEVGDEGDLYGWDDWACQYDDDPNPYSGDYNED